MLRYALFAGIALLIMIAIVLSASAGPDKYLIAGTVLMTVGALLKWAARARRHPGAERAGHRRERQAKTRYR